MQIDFDIKVRNVIKCNKECFGIAFKRIHNKFIELCSALFQLSIDFKCSSLTYFMVCILFTFYIHKSTSPQVHNPHISITKLQNHMERERIWFKLNFIEMHTGCSWCTKWKSHHFVVRYYILSFGKWVERVVFFFHVFSYFFCAK